MAWQASRTLLPVGATKNHTASPGLIYRLIKTAQPNTWEYEHRAVMAAILGRPLAQWEHVHHQDSDTLNNDPSNLVLLEAAEHTREHHSLNGRWSVKHNCCVVCGTVARKHLAKGKCTACYQRRNGA